MSFMSNIFRLFQILSTFAHYRLHYLLKGTVSNSAFLCINLLTFIFPRRWFPCSAAKDARLQKALESLGPFYIKLGQLLATRADLFPPELLNELKKLQDQVKPFDNKQAQKLLNQSLNAEALEHIKNISEQPLAAGSIAQVYEANLERDGKNLPIILKLLRPNIRSIIEKDMSLMKRMASLVSSIWSDAELFQFRRAIEDYEHIIFEELDLKKEAQKTETMRRNFEHSSELYIPVVYHEYCTHNLFVAEKINAIPVNELERLQDFGIDLPALSKIGVNIFFKQVFEHNYFHADMHPGNIFVNPERPKQPQYMSIDCAIVGTLTEKEQILLGKLILSLVQKDYEQLIRIIARAGWLPPSANMSQIIRETEQILEPIAEGNMAEMGFADSILGLFQVIRIHRIILPIEFMLLLKTLVHIEGLGRGIDPQLNVWPIATPIVKNWLNKKLGFKATAKKLMDQSPLILNALSDMPNFFLDAPKQLRMLESELHNLSQANKLQISEKRKQSKRFYYLNICSALVIFALSFILERSELMQVSLWLQLFAGWLFFAALIFRK